ncbi:MAG TPA: hypothetical protein VLF69_06380 [Candidatus Saccharimonadales bacterium]|nr:hypothetical protein [Candidatus Saccharimonadales bacterium]
MNVSPETLHKASSRTILGIDFYLTSKYRLAKMLTRADSIAKERGHKALFNISPRTFVFPGDFQEWRAAAHAEPNTIWISKPGDGARGEGIYLVTNVDAVKPEQNLVLQEYIANPHLLGGYKYTLRVFALVTSLDPLRAWIFPDGLTKMATQLFTTDRASLDNLFIHLTNPGVLRRDKSADFAAQRITHREYRKRLRQEAIDDARLFQRIHTIVAKSLLAVREPALQVLQRSTEQGIETNGQFMLIGYDILVDASLRPWIIEANAGPSLETEAGNNTVSGKHERQLKERIATDTLRLAGSLPPGKVRFESLFPSAAMLDWLPCYEVVREHDQADLKSMHEELYV